MHKTDGSAWTAMSNKKGVSLRVQQKIGVSKTRLNTRFDLPKKKKKKTNDQNKNSR
jgi:hypothetical protein